jgi:undecaprenyl diphosphate synthase
VAGVEAIRELLRHAVRRGVPVLTLYAFSRENWARTDEEVTGLFGLLEGAIRSETAELRREGVRVRLLGRLDELPEETRRSIGSALDATAGGERLLLNIAFNYAGRTELVDAVRRLIAAGAAPDSIDEATVGAALYTAGLPDPDLVIRTGGEQRLSNFLIWQSAYAEFFFSDALWPDFGPAEFDAALLEFASRHRRFGR